MAEFEKVERPGSGTISDPLLTALLDTVNGGAIKVNLTGQNLINYQSNLRAKLRKHNMRLRYKYNKTDKSCIFWVEAQDGGEEQPINATFNANSTSAVDEAEGEDRPSPARN